MSGPDGTEIAPPPQNIAISDGTKAPPRKRRRIVISCTECHRRKQKCDRQMPCTNCQTRNKSSACHYETGTPVPKVDRRDSSNSSGQDRPPEASDPAVPVKAADFGYSHNGVSTLGILRRIEGAGEPLAGMPGEGNIDDGFGLCERYKTLIRQLPAREYIDKLANIYFHDINWQYFGVDEPLFRALMDLWYNLPFQTLSRSGPQALDPMLRAFPALLFQMLASSLLYLPDGSGPTFESLKYTSQMTFDDLAYDYSESGNAILSLLGKRQMSIITVLAGWVRAAYLKVTEAWHQVGTCIRDAQEIGLHRDQMDPQPTADDSTEEVLEKMWMAQHRRTIWQILLTWDLHTGAVLGRPTSVDFRPMNRSPPLDAIIPRNPKRVPLVPRTENDPPTPLTRALWAFEVMRPLRDIIDLEKEGPFPKDFSKVEKIHQDILDLQARTPPPFRLENPDTRFDHLPECWWLPVVRPNLPQIPAFNMMALHRPYVFTRPDSRREALLASIQMLESQRQQFAVLQPAQHRTFALFFGTFDAIVMIASIYILFPKEHPELLSKTRQHFQWAVERFETMARRNRLAQAALGVLHAIWIRFKKAVSNGFLSHPSAAPETTCAKSSETEAAGSDTQTPSSQSGFSSSHQPSLASASGSSSIMPTPVTEQTNPISPSTGLTPASGTDNQNNILSNQEWSLPPNFDFSSIMPMYPMGDLAYNDLTGIFGGAGSGASTGGWSEPAPATSPALVTGGMPALHTVAPGQEEVPWQFGGEFGSDTIWNLLNQIPPN
ncbi:Uu.00g063720.m01.CDS01 [Anthostomella pinea]|uniref:Uu.00g063720.m01.CDS01 n=1 Tax=Anthostomella pinea TaxID=933095 RepID=A0AAI8VTE2_9PEZI|nr:Uu.00g063720.m01.CDS01 [Anthostomella pinea]